MSDSQSPRPSQQPQWLQHAMRSAPWRRQSQLVAMIALALIVAIIIGALYLAQATTTATLGRQREDRQAYRDRLVRENEELRAEVAEMRGIPRLELRARELGFNEATGAQQEYLVVQGYLPEQVESVAPLEPNAVPLPDYDETFSGWLGQSWEALVNQFEDWVGSQNEARGQ